MSRRALGGAFLRVERRVSSKGGGKFFEVERSAKVWKRRVSFSGRGAVYAALDTRRESPDVRPRAAGECDLSAAAAAS